MKKKSLYLECYSGISGDMAVGALLDLGADKDKLNTALYSLEVKGFKTEITRVSRFGLNACDFNVILDEKHENHDHDDSYLYGKKESHSEKIHCEHRKLADVLNITNSADMSEHAKALAEKMFTILANAEAKAHGMAVEEVHFHEIGAVDSIADIISAAVCFDSLDIDDVIISELRDGKGFIRCQHGLIPVPVPAVSNIASEHDLTICIMDVEGEYVTPTGAAIAAALKTSSDLPEKFKILKIGMGAGKRKTERTGILRAMLIESENPENKDTICKMECNIDDCDGETLGFASERLMAAGAKDVHYIPVFMKKNRPAYILSVICDTSDAEKMERIIFEETTTIGVRRVMMERTVLPREIVSVVTPYGAVDVKICEYNGNKYVHPEYENVAEICRKNKISYRAMCDIVRSAYSRSSK